MTGPVDHVGLDQGLDTDKGALLAEVRGSVLRLLTELPRLPERIRVSAQDISVELEWPTCAPAPSAPAPSAPHSSTCAPSAVGAAEAGTRPAKSGPLITAPTVGTFYRSPEPGASPFVEVGDTVRAGQQVAILEAMKLMLPVHAEIGGMLSEVLIEDGHPVEYGEPLFVLAAGDLG